MGRFALSSFWSQSLLKFKEVNDVNAHFYELKQSQKKLLDPKNGSCSPTLSLTVKQTPKTLITHV